MRDEVSQQPDFDELIPGAFLTENGGRRDGGVGGGRAALRRGGEVERLGELCWDRFIVITILHEGQDEFTVRKAFIVANVRLIIRLFLEYSVKCGIAGM